MLGAAQFARRFSTSQAIWAKMKVAIIGQSQFGEEVYKLLRRDGHEIVGVFTIPDQKGKPDPLASAADSDGVKVFKFPRWRVKGQPIDEVVAAYKEVGAEVNVMPFCSQFIPMNVIDHPKNGSIIYHPSLLPRHRGASAINWTLMCGDQKGGFTIFWADDGLDTGPILLKKECDVEPNDTVDTIYNRFLYPEGIKAMGEAVQLIADGKAPRITQPEEGATYDKIWKKKEVAEINWEQSAETLHNFIRGNDKIPGAWTKIDNQQVTMFGSSMYTGSVPQGTSLEIAGCSKPGIVHKNGLLLFGNDGKMLNVKTLQLEDGRMIQAAKYGQAPTEEARVELTADEQQMEESIKAIWAGILSNDNIQPEMDFFKMGAGSMDVARLVEEVKMKCNGIELQNEDVYMATTFDAFVQLVVRKGRGEGEEEFTYDAIEMNINNMDIRFPHQLFIDNQFVDATGGNTYKTINPTDESVICELSKATVEDVDTAVAAAKTAFYEGEWGKMNARDRGKIMFKLADLMEEHKEELATIESIDSGAVYTLAIKTHVGMSIDTFRYFAGWCDKIQGTTIPINHARPNRNLTYTKKEPLGVCAIVIPWNYPLMMLAWKMAACIAAGNTVVLKPAQVTPLTALKFAELTVKAGFPPGVINILPGSGSIVGQRMADHPDVRKLGFTGSTPIGKQIMKSCAVSNLKKVSLELGGKSPLVIFADCNMDMAVRQALGAVFFNKGENCIAAGRLFVEDTIHDEFIQRVIAEVKKMKIGDPLDRSTSHGPQNHRSHLEKLLEYCEIGIKEGATCVYGGKQVDRPGLVFSPAGVPHTLFTFLEVGGAGLVADHPTMQQVVLDYMLAVPSLFMSPTVMTGVEDHMMLAKEESFGPIMVVSKFSSSDIDGMLKSANGTDYGLASGVFTNDISKAMYVSDKLDAGTVFINTYNKTDVAAPFGGFKQSGFGKDLGQDALHEYMKTKTVTVEY